MNGAVNSVYSDMPVCSIVSIFGILYTPCQISRPRTTTSAVERKLRCIVYMYVVTPQIDKDKDKCNHAQPA